MVKNGGEGKRHADSSFEFGFTFQNPGVVFRNTLVEGTLFSSDFFKDPLKDLGGIKVVPL